ncbi:transcriptional regulator, LacI family [Kaistia soli DSM 19436]|uniref:Transcriptional regulator, LacI family n=1 Tax=Kaistia soli DSM 19436 TaxID=1122133 RepID=A0A1M4X3W0_9HYPH|nr:LacI family DNA-binding transcriptional regulator [Kaistia soli]SHE88137.1 transcriptional regulator, LacI family [Kaistia soli DSM 19436]
MIDSITEQPGRRPTIDDVARAAGVGVATVDRVLNKRARVRHETAARVLAAAEAIGYHGAGLLRRRLDEAPVEKNFGFLLQRRGDAFYRNLSAALTGATRGLGRLRGRPVVEFVDDISAATVARQLLSLGARVDGLAIVAADHPAVNAAVDDLAARGIPVVTLLSELSGPVAGHFGIDHRKAGRTAAWMISRLAREPGVVGVLVGSHRFLGHELSEISFRSYFREHAPRFRLLESFSNLEDPGLAYEGTLELVKRNPDLAGLYLPGGGMAGMVAALREARAARHIVAVCNELIPETRAALLDGVLDAVIDTPIEALAERAVAMLATLVSDGPAEAGSTHLLPFGLTVSENV